MLAVLDNVLLGRIVAAYPWYSKVVPTTDAQCHVPIVCATSRAHGVFHGNKLDFVSHLEPLVVDELVVTSGDGLLYPQGLAVGRIKNFMLNDLGFLYEVAVEPLYDIAMLGYCSIISKNTQHAQELL
jgi:rod shape-determining protein MreC